MARNVKKKPIQSRVIRSKYLADFDEDMRRTSLSKEAAAAAELRSIPELLSFLEANPKFEVDARILAVHRTKNEKTYIRAGRKEFLEAARRGPRLPNNQRMSESAITRRLREVDHFATDTPSGANLIGNDFIPLLGGPFNKQQYYHDYIKAHMTAFYSYNHDPMARFIINTIRDFTLGRSFRVDAKAKDEKTRVVAQALWDAFSEVNDLPTLMDQSGLEGSIYGELMVWTLPGNRVADGYMLKPGEEVKRGLLPRVRLIDPSCIWDIITEPEDITQKLAYQWIAPTQYQVFTHDDKTGKNVDTLKFIYRQIPAEQVAHYRINSVSNEKRGRGDLYPVLGYLKFLRDSVAFSVIQTQKAAAWAIDTQIDGSQDDIDAYAQAQTEMKTVPPAGSEFIHSKAVTRTYLANQTSSGSSPPSFEWSLSMIAAGTGIPISYFGTHLSGGQTRASAMVSTEPAVKKFEGRRAVYERMLRDMFDNLMRKFGIQGVSCEVTFPEIVVQDRSAKLKDLAAAEASGWISRKRAATIASKELGITDFDYETEKAEVEGETIAPPESSNPLSAPPGFGGGKTRAPERADVTSQDEKRRLADGKGA